MQPMVKAMVKTQVAEWLKALASGSDVYEAFTTLIRGCRRGEGRRAGA